MRVLTVICAVLAAPVAAQDVAFSPAATQACMHGATGVDGLRACIGVSAEQCMTDTVGGYSTYGMGGCLSAELDYWDAELNAVYADVMASARRADAATDEYNTDFPSEADALRDMQRAWITYRDATCDYEYLQWGGGTGGGPAIAGCLMRLTGEQAIYLRHSRLGE